MILYMVSVRDSAAQAFMAPSFVPSTGVAVRAFRDECNRKAEDNIFSKHPGDMELFHLGQFDPESASFEIFPHPVSLIRGKDCVVTE